MVFHIAVDRIFRGVIASDSEAISCATILSRRGDCFAIARNDTEASIKYSVTNDWLLSSILGALACWRFVILEALDRLRVGLASCFVADLGLALGADGQRRWLARQQRASPYWARLVFQPCP